MGGWMSMGQTGVSLASERATSSPTQAQSLGVGQILFIAGASTSVDAGATD
jgi:hypothetical protein